MEFKIQYIVSSILSLTYTCTLYIYLKLIAPINEAIEYEEKDLFNPFYTKTIYRGPPTPELEEAWEDLWLCKWKFPILIICN